MQQSEINSNKNVGVISWHPLAWGKDWEYTSGFQTITIPDMRKLASYMRSFHWAGIEWDGGYRNKENFLNSDFCVLDFDKGNTTLEDAKNIFKEFQHVIGTTENHRKQKGKEPPCDRFRVAIPWLSTITDLRDYEWNMRKMQRKFGSDYQATGAHMKFKPCKKIVAGAVDGKKMWWGKAPPPKPYEPSKFKGTRQIPPDICHTLMHGIVPWGRHSQAASMAMRLAISGLEADEIIKLFSGSALMDSEDPQHNRDIKRTVRDACKKAQNISN